MVRNNILLSAFILVAGCLHTTAQPVCHDRVTLTTTAQQLDASPAGPFDASWQSLESNYKTPAWFMDAKFGIFIHWGPYSVAAAGSEWYPRHMYAGMAKHHRNVWGSQKLFGYKDFIPLFKAEKFDAEQWAQLFRDAGARYVIPTAEHHDGFAMYDSKLTRWDAKDMGPCRDVIGELANAVRAKDMKFGVSNHRVENWDFMYPSLPLDSTDLFDANYADFYGPPQKPTEQSAMGPKAKRVEANGATEAVIDEAAAEGRHPQSDEFLNEWQVRVMELVDKYQPDLIFFDNGVNYRSMDPWKLKIAKYYYNSANQWGREVSLLSKGRAYLHGSILDCERQSRAPKEKTENYWQVDEPIGHKFGYVEGLQLKSADGIIRSLVNNISKNGNLCLNVSPRGDGSIPEDQQKVLRRIGEWLRQYGEGVYNTRAYVVSGENNVRYTCKGNSLVYAFVLKWNGKPFAISAIGKGRIKSVVGLHDGKPVAFTKTDNGYMVEASSENVSDPAVCFRIELE